MIMNFKIKFPKISYAALVFAVFAASMTSAGGAAPALTRFGLAERLPAFGRQAAGVLVSVTAVTAILCSTRASCQYGKVHAQLNPRHSRLPRGRTLLERGPDSLRLLYSERFGECPQSVV